MYPHHLPIMVLITDGWTKDDVYKRTSHKLHLDIVTYLQGMFSPSNNRWDGHVIVYELFQFVQESLRVMRSHNEVYSKDDTQYGILAYLPGGSSGQENKQKLRLTKSKSKSLLVPKKQNTNTKKKKKTKTNEEEPNNIERTNNYTDPNPIPPRSVHNHHRHCRCTREHHNFWNTQPQHTPPAIPFPKLSMIMEKARKELPAAAVRTKVLNMMKKMAETSAGRIILVTDDTGCGKTTQIPQFILEDSPEHAKIVVTQTRRLAAIGVTNRVANERNESSTGH